MAIAIGRPPSLGATAYMAPSAGNAGLALAVYAARHGLPALVAFPEDIPPAFVRDCRFYGAEVIVAGATIREAGAAMRRYAAENKAWEQALDLSTLREPYRLEGKKTMGYEIAEQLGGRLPDLILYPTGGGRPADRHLEGDRGDDRSALARRSDPAPHARRPDGGMRADRRCLHLVDLLLVLGLRIADPVESRVMIGTFTRSPYVGNQDAMISSKTEMRPYFDTRYA